MGDIIDLCFYIKDFERLLSLRDDLDVGHEQIMRVVNVKLDRTF